ncbi:uncharacterized protein LOC133313715 [Gastrolobium bilobum]|uniref:uncharacterized protein LOC133313715 n=1 Tax=Gastrolobium bilobum TaxID=150636 RepID=UPI002AB1C6B5|nr:uncharacterized protein LOC133313715 [Gastrolobium bilobum]
MEPPAPSYSLFHLNNPFSLHCHPQMHDPIFFFILVLSLSFLSFTFLSFSLYKRFLKTHKHTREQPGLTHNPERVAAANHSSVSRVVDEVPRPGENSPTHLTRSVLLEVLPSDSAKWASLFDDPDSVSSGQEGPGEEQRGKKKKRKTKKKRMNSVTEEKGEERANTGSGSDSGVRLESACLYPFTSSGSAMQRKIKQQYDELVKCNESKKLTLSQVLQFANSLVDARNELQHKADVIQRKFVITKALLCKADRSSFDRLHQQIYKLELEQKRLEEDAFVYNSLQQQLKLSPAYQKMLEVGACMEKEKSCGEGENRDDEFADISFEELLAQEKKDSYWQKNGKSRLCSS